jgi:selenide,water dikinase
MKIRLTQTVQKGGCAAKISAEVLRESLGKVDFKTNDPNVLVDGRHFDDAGIYQVTNEIALVQTLDFFTPIVDTPEWFGRIASANALSDVYAMGGTPKTCMAILAFPLATLDPDIMTEVLSGAQKTVSESGSSMIGGHSIDDDTLKFGLSVTGLVNPSKMWTNQGAEPGDQLILTKALGTGTLTAGLKNSDYDEDTIREAMESMCQLNSVLDLIPETLQADIHAATDITGFGLAGHSMQLAKASKVMLKLNYASLPVFGLAFDSLRAENLTKAHRSNQSYTQKNMRWNFKAPEIESKIIFDPQTSGGLLLSVSKNSASSILKALRSRFQKASIIGEVVSLKDPNDPIQVEWND